MLVSEESCVDGLRLIFHILLLVCFGLVEEIATLAGEEEAVGVPFLSLLVTLPLSTSRDSCGRENI